MYNHKKQILKKVKLTFVVEDEVLIKGAQYELENGNIELAAGMLESERKEFYYEIEELPNR